MKRSAIVLTAVVFALVATVSVANAAKYKQTGQVVGDRNAKVQLRVKTNRKDKAIEVAGFKAKGVLTKCGKEIVRYQYNALSPIPVLKNEFKIVLSGSGGAKLTISGKIKRKGKATKGSLKSNRFAGDNGTICKTPKQRFKTST